MTSWDTDRDGDIDVPFFCRRRQREIRPKPVFDPGDAFVKLQPYQRLTMTANVRQPPTYNQLDAICTISLQQGLGETSCTVALFSSTFFIKPHSHNDCSMKHKVTGQQGVDGGQHGNEIGLVVLGATAPDKFAIVVARKRRIRPLFRS